jgi:ATP-dependent helicase HrpB
LPLHGDLSAEELRSGGRARAVVRLASAIEPEWLLDLHPESLRDQTELRWEESRGRVEAVSRLLYDQVVLEEARRPPRLEEADAAAKVSQVSAACMAGERATASPPARRQRDQ